MRLLLAARLSRKQKDGQDGIGIETQDKRAREWAEREGHVIVATVPDTKSGTVAPWDRKNLRGWVTDPAKMAQYDGVLAYKTDRLSRGSQEDFTRIEHWATLHGKALVIADGPQYPARDDSDYWRWAAEKRGARTEWEAIRERCLRSQRELTERGVLTNRAPWGYEIAGERYGKALVPDAEGRQYAEEIFRRVAAGETLACVARWMEAETGRQWWARTVGLIVRNTVYRGYRADAAGRVVHKCEALVSPALWQDANAALAGRPKRGPQAKESTAMLTGALYCGRPSCTAGPDSPMYRITGRWRKGGEWVKVPYYRCYGRGAGAKGCGNMVRLEVADAAANAIAAEWLALAPVIVMERDGDHVAELADTRDALLRLPSLGLPEEEEDARRAELRARRAELAELVKAGPQWTEVERGTYADEYAAVPANKRGEWLRRNGLTLQATKTGMWFRENSPQVLSLLKRVITVPAAPGPFGECPEHTVTDVVTDRMQLIYKYPV